MRHELDFPIVRQSMSFSCSCASMAACLAYYGKDVREGELIREMGLTVRTKEVKPEKMVKVLERHGLRAVYRKLTAEDLEGYVKRGVPVIVNLQAWSDAGEPRYKDTDTNGHYAVVIGYDDSGNGSFVFSDPCSYLRVRLGRLEFEDRWHDGDSKDWDYKRIGIVVGDGKGKYDSEEIVPMR